MHDKKLFQKWKWLQLATMELRDDLTQEERDTLSEWGDRVMARFTSEGRLPKKPDLDWPLATDEYVEAMR